MSFCVVPRSSAEEVPCSSALATYSASNHAAVALIVIDVFICAGRDLVEQRPHVADVGHRDADLADLALRHRVGRVVPGLRR